MGETQLQNKKDKEGIDKDGAKKLECGLQMGTERSSVQWFNHVQLFATPCTAAHQDSLSITNSRACSNSYP